MTANKHSESAFETVIDARPIAIGCTPLAGDNLRVPR